MAGFDRIYYLGDEGGFMGADGLNTIDLEILHGVSDREWYEAKYWTAFAPMGRVRVFVPSAPDDPDALLDAFLIFAPEIFQGCGGIDEAILGIEESGVDRLDFNADGMPDAWNLLREHAWPIFKNLPIYSAELTSMNRFSRGA
jgi:hypothetical protein